MAENIIPKFGRWGLLHGQSKTPEWYAWRDMRRRCYSIYCKSYKHYGGRGIVVCTEWLHSFEAFLADMGPRPAGLTLERINNNGNYEPGNCKWATQQEQCGNKRTNTPVTFNGETKNLSEWAKQIGLRHNVLRRRLLRGWTVERAISTPAQKRTLKKH